MRVAGQDSKPKKLGWRPDKAFWGPYMEQEMPWDDAEDSDDSQSAPKKKKKKDSDAFWLHSRHLMK